MIVIFRSNWFSKNKELSIYRESNKLFCDFVYGVSLLLFCGGCKFLSF